MEIFVIHDGVQSGPFRVFELREKIAAGTIHVSDKGWYRGLDAWKPLNEIDALSDAIPGGADESEAEAPPAVEEGIPEAEALGRHPWIRFGARITDSTLFSLAIALPAFAFGLEPDQPPSERAIIAFQVLTTLGWMLVDAALLTTFGTTPGKAIAGLRVSNAEGRPPAAGKSLVRSLLLFVFGVGFGLPLLMLLSFALSHVRLKQLGGTLWDDRAGTRVLGEPVSQLRRSLLFIVPLVVVSITVALSWGEFVAFWNELDAAKNAAGGDAI